MTKLPNRIREIRKRAKLTLEQLGERVGLSPGQVSRIETGERLLNTHQLGRFATALRCTKQDLLSSEPDTANKGEAKEVPTIAWANAKTFAENGPLAMISKTTGTLWAGTTNDGLFSLQVSDTSMSLEAPTGSFIIVDPKDRDLTDHKLYLFDTDEGDPVFRRFRSSQGPDRLEPASHDPNHHTIFPNGKISPLGRVIQIIRIL